MLTNPYPPPTSEDDKAALRFQTYLSGEDKSLLMCIRPAKSTAQAVINNLIKNICNDLRDLDITSFRVDADDIFCVLTERRPLTDEQITRLRRTTVGASQKVPTWLQQHSRRTGVRKDAPDHTAGASNPTGKVNGGKQHNRKTKSKSSEGKEETSNS